jgi:hypothetical protein
VLSVIDARRGEVFVASYRFERSDAATDADADQPIDPELVRDDHAQPVAPEALMAWLSHRSPGGGRISVVGDGAVRYRELLAADASVDLGWGGARPVPAGDLLPDYRRPADARINWEQRAPQVPAPSAQRRTR